MADHQDRHAVAVAEPAQHLEDLRLHGHVERAGRLVGQQHLRAQCDGERDRDALGLAARQLMRIALEQVGREHHLAHPGPRPLARFAAPDTVEAQRAQKDVANPEDRVEGRNGILEDHRDSLAAHPAQRAAGETRQLESVEADAAGDARARGLGEPEHGEGRHRLARATLSDQSEDLLAREVELLDRDHASFAEADLQGAHRELHRRATRRGSRRSRRPSPTRL